MNGRMSRCRLGFHRDVSKVTAVEVRGRSSYRRLGTGMVEREGRLRTRETVETLRGESLSFLTSTPPDSGFNSRRLTFVTIFTLLLLFDDRFTDGSDYVVKTDRLAAVVFRHGWSGEGRKFFLLDKDSVSDSVSNLECLDPTVTSFEAFVTSHLRSEELGLSLKDVVGQDRTERNILASPSDEGFVDSGIATFRSQRGRSGRTLRGSDRREIRGTFSSRVVFVI